MLDSTVWLIESFDPHQGIRTMASGRHYTLHFNSIKVCIVFPYCAVVLSYWSALERFPVIIIPRTALFGEEALAETGILRNSGHAGLEGVIHRACRGRTL